MITWSLMYDKLKWLHHVPNGGLRSKATAGKLKGQGVKAGVADLFLPFGRDGWHGLYIEMKRPDGKGKQSKDQKEFEEHCHTESYLYVVCNTAGEAINEIQTYMRMN